MTKKIATLDQQFEKTLRRVRAEFERTGEIHPRFKCVTDAESFDVPANWSDRSEKAAACAALRDSFRRRRVNRYLFASEGWVRKTPGLLPNDDPNRGECVQVTAVERNGPRRFAFAETTRNEGTAPRAVASEQRCPAKLVGGVVGRGPFRPSTQGRPALCRGNVSV